MEPSLKFVEEPYPLRHLGNLLAQFRAKGFVVLPNVFERESVDGFRQEVEAAVVKNQGGRLELPEDRPELVYPLRAPRIRAPLCGALSPSQIATKASVFETAWLINQSGEMTDDWHKDRQHDVGMPGNEYHYPLGVHLGIYYRDMEDIEDGPTAVVPRSHQDQSLNPYNGSAQELFLARKEDVVMWDQRLWHRANSRQKEGWRIFTIYGFYAVQAFQGYPIRQMAKALAQAWIESKGTADEVFYGGAFSLDSVRRGLKEAKKTGA